MSFAHVQVPCPSPRLFQYPVPPSCAWSGQMAAEDGWCNCLAWLLIASAPCHSEFEVFWLPIMQMQTVCSRTIEFAGPAGWSSQWWFCGQADLFLWLFASLPDWPHNFLSLGSDICRPSSESRQLDRCLRLLALLHIKRIVYLWEHLKCMHRSANSPS